MKKEKNKITNKVADEFTRYLLDNSNMAITMLKSLMVEMLYKKNDVIWNNIELKKPLGNGKEKLSKRKLNECSKTMHDCILKIKQIVRETK